MIGLIEPHKTLLMIHQRLPSKETKTELPPVGRETELQTSTYQIGVQPIIIISKLLNNLTSSAPTTGVAKYTQNICIK